MNRNTVKKIWKENKSFVLFIVLMFAMRSSFADWYHIPSASMQPNLIEGDRILVDKMAYRLDIPFTDTALFTTGAPQRGDVVVFESEAANNRLIKRVVGIAGDTVSMTDNKLRVNGVPATYESLSHNLYQETSDTSSRIIKLEPKEGVLSSFGTVTVPAEHILVLGDNRNNSADSRYYGFVPISELSGRATTVITSFNPDNYYIPRADRFLEKL